MLQKCLCQGQHVATFTNFQCRVTEIILYQDDIIELSADETYVIMSNNPKVIHINYNNFHRVVKVGNKVNINRRTIHLVCTDIVGAVVVCKVLKGGTVLSGSRVHLPGIPVDMPALNDIDKRVLTFAVESGIDIIFAAYVRDETTVNEIRQFLGPAGKHIMICSEIENLQGIVNIDEIIKASDAIMVARLDLANEIADEKVFLAQRSIISKCNVVGKPVVCTTHLLESMMYSRIPSRSESTDIANAIMNGVDCVMLYHETALGDYPVATVKQAVAMCKQAEPAIWQKRMVMDLSKKVRRFVSVIVNLFLVDPGPDYHDPCFGSGGCRNFLQLIGFRYRHHYCVHEICPFVVKV